MSKHKRLLRAEERTAQHWAFVNWLEENKCDWDGPWYKLTERERGMLFDACWKQFQRRLAIERDVAASLSGRRMHGD